MRLSKSKLFAVQVANFATIHKMTPRDVVELVVLAERAFNAGVRSCNEGSKDATDREARTGTAFENAARAAGFGTDWSGGLWPHLRKGAEWISVPCESD